MNNKIKNGLIILCMIIILNIIISCHIGIEGNPFLGGESNIWKEAIWIEQDHIDCDTNEYFKSLEPIEARFRYNGQMTIIFYGYGKMQPPPPYLHGVYNFDESGNFSFEVIRDNRVLLENIDLEGTYNIIDNETIILYDLFFGSDFYEEEPEIGCGYFLKLERTYFD